MSPTLMKKLIPLALLLTATFALYAGGGKERPRSLDPAFAQDVAVFPQIGHSGPVTSVAFSPDGKRVVSGSHDNTLKVWDAETGQEIRTIAGINSLVQAVAYSPNGRLIAADTPKPSGTSGYNAGVTFWDAETGRKLRSTTGCFHSPDAIAFSPDGRRIAGGELYGTILVWDVESGRKLYTLSGHNEAVTSVAFSPDSRRIASSSGGSGKKTGAVKLWDAETGRELRTFSGHDGAVSSVAFSPDGRRIASCSGSLGYHDSTMKLWNAETGQELWSTLLVRNSFAAQRVAFSPDGRHIAGGDKLWDAETGQELRPLPVGSTFSISADGRRIVSGNASRVIKLWDMDTGQELRTLSGQGAGVEKAAFSPDGRWIASGSGPTRLWDTETGQELRTLTGIPVDFSSDGKRILSLDLRTIRIWDTETGRELQPPIQLESSATSAAFSPDGRRVVSGLYKGNDGLIKLWDAETGKELWAMTRSPLPGKNNADIRSVAFSPDGRRIVSCSMDPAIMLWDAETGRELRTISGKGAYAGSVAFSPDGTRLVSDNHSNIKLWDTETGQELRTLSGHTASVDSVSFSPDGRRIVSGSWDTTIKIWDAETGRELRTLSGHGSPVNSAVYSKDGKRIVSASDDGTTRLWDAETGREIVQFVGFKGSDTALSSGSRGLTVELEARVNAVDGEWVAMTPDGYFNASPRGDRYLKVRTGSAVSGIDAYRSVFNNPDVVQARLQGLPDPVSKGGVTIQQAASFRPPTVTIQSPAPGSSVTTAATNLSVVIDDQNQPLQNIKLLVNGRLLGQDELGSITGTGGLKAEKASLSIAGNQKTISFQLPVNLDPGQNIIEVVAFNGYAESRKTVELTWRTQTGQQIALPNLWILAVGVNQYENAGTRLGGLSNLNFCVNDAREIISSFKNQEGKRYGKVNSLLIADGAALSPTAQNIRENLKFLAGAGPRDVILFFLAGHGISDRTGRFFFLPRDAALNADGSINPDRALSTDDIVSVLDEPGNRLVFIDACQSGGVDSNRLIRSLMNSNAFVFSASQGNEASLELADLKHGAFTYSIIRELQGAGAAKSIGSVGMLQLSGFVSSEVIRITSDRQHPKPYYQGYHDFPVAEIE